MEQFSWVAEFAKSTGGDVSDGFPRVLAETTTVLTKSKMKPYEIAWRVFEPFLPAIYGRVRGDIRRLIAPGRDNMIVDVGGRRSPYTVGIDASITILDLPRTTSFQEDLDLALTDEAVSRIKRQRSNVVDVVLGDVLDEPFRPASFDGAIAVEVIEHVEDAEGFVAAIARALKPDAWVYVTTPNGDYIPNENPDHKRHYLRSELQFLLAHFFEDVYVDYAVGTGKHQYRGLAGMNPRKPLTSLVAMGSNVMSRRESKERDGQWRRTAHLIAVGKRPRRR